MTKSEVIENLSAETGKTKAETERFMKAYDKTIIEGLKKDGKVRLGDLGFINLAYRKPRDGVNPKDPTQKYEKAESATATFRPSSELRATVTTPEMVAFAKSIA